MSPVSLVFHTIVCEIDLKNVFGMNTPIITLDIHFSTVERPPHLFRFKGHSANKSCIIVFVRCFLFRSTKRNILKYTETSYLKNMGVHYLT